MDDDNSFSFATESTEHKIYAPKRSAQHSLYYTATQKSWFRAAMKPMKSSTKWKMCPHLAVLFWISIFIGVVALRMRSQCTNTIQSKWRRNLNNFYSFGSRWVVSLFFLLQSDVWPRELEQITKFVPKTYSVCSSVFFIFCAKKYHRITGRTSLECIINTRIKHGIIQKYYTAIVVSVVAAATAAVAIDIKKNGRSLCRTT